MSFLKLIVSDKTLEPTVKEPGSAGIDLKSDSMYIIGAGDKPVIIKTGIIVKDMKGGFFGSIREKSGNGVRGLAVRGGVIDCSYRGEIGVIVQNNMRGRPGFVKRAELSKCVFSETCAKLLNLIWKNNDIVVDKGDSVAQLIVIPYVPPAENFSVNGEEINPLTDKERADDGGLWRESNS